MANAEPNYLFLMSQIRTRAFKFLNTRLQARGIRDLSAADGDVLFAVFRHQPLDMQAISRLTLKDKSTITGVVQTLEQKGYLHRQPSASDGRRIEVSLTPKAAKISARLLAISRAFNRRLLKNISAPEAAQLADLLERLLHNLAD